MQYFKISNLSFCYEEQVENLFNDISCEINTEDKIGLVGENGCGKTTLFKIMLGEQDVKAGVLNRNQNLKIGYLPQKLIFSENITVADYLWMINPALLAIKQKIEAEKDFTSDNINLFTEFEEKGGYSFENKYFRILSRFQLDEKLAQQKLEQISGGEKTKVALCRLLLKDSDVLLLDEPTNHLDVQTLQWLENFLSSIKIPYVIISHDRKFLDQCVNKIWELEDKTLSVYTGNYSFYKTEKETDFQTRIHTYQSQQKKIKQLEKAFTDRKEWAASHQQQTGKEGNAHVYESITNAAKRSMQRAKNVEKRMQKMIEKAKEDKVFIKKKREFFLQAKEIKAQHVLKVTGLGKSFSEIPVFKDTTFTVGRNTKLAITGSNGSGKTTLLRIITGFIKQSGGTFSWTPAARIGYFSQEHEILDEDKSILEQVLQGDMEKMTYARTVLGCLNIRGDRVYQQIKTTSLGEKTKVALAKILVSDVNVLVLDEPTNHLEISAREALEKALVAFQNPIIFVSHDRYFVEKLATDQLDMDSGEYRAV